MKKKLLIGLLLCFLCFSLVGCTNEENQNENNNNNNIIQEQKDLGNVEKETVNVLIAKFNTEIMDSGLNTPAYDEYMVTQNGIYWYALTEEISIYVKPVEFSDSKENDIVDMSTIYVDKEGFDEQTAINYTEKLIKANNYELTDTEIKTLLKDAKDLMKDKTMANNGKGISVGILEVDNHYEYQIKRIY